MFERLLRQIHYWWLFTRTIYITTIYQVIYIYRNCKLLTNKKLLKCQAYKGLGWLKLFQRFWLNEIMSHCFLKVFYKVSSIGMMNHCTASWVNHKYKTRLKVIVRNKHSISIGVRHPLVGVTNPKYNVGKVHPF